MFVIVTEQSKYVMSVQDSHRLTTSHQSSAATTANTRKLITTCKKNLLCTILTLLCIFSQLEVIDLLDKVILRVKLFECM